LIKRTKGFCNRLRSPPLRQRRPIKDPFRLGPTLSRASLIAAISLVASIAFAALTFPALTGRVVDDAGILSQAARARIEAKEKELEEKSGIQLVVATIPSLQGADIESFGYQLGRYWKLGEAKKNNGVLFLVAPNERKTRIDVGYGLEGTLTDALSKVIIATAVTPNFKKGDFDAGVERGVDAIVEILTTDSGEWQKRAKLRSDGQPDPFDQIIPFIIFLLIVFAFLWMARNASGGRRYGQGAGPIIFLPPGHDPWGDSSSGGGSWGGGSSWGGDGGFSGGGGSFGGGGASGDW
jgi:uncharacterized protein